MKGVLDTNALIGAFASHQGDRAMLGEALAGLNEQAHNREPRVVLGFRGLFARTPGARLISFPPYNRRRR